MLIFSDKLNEDNLNKLFPDSEIVVIDINDDEVQSLINSSINNYNNDSKIVITYNINDDNICKLISYYSSKREWFDICVKDYRDNIIPNNNYPILYVGKLYNKLTVYNPEEKYYTNVNELTDMIYHLSVLYHTKRISYDKIITKGARNTLIFVEGVNTPPNDLIGIESVLKAHSDIKIDNNIESFSNTYNLFHINTDYTNKFSYSTFYDEEEYH